MEAVYGHKDDFNWPADEDVGHTDDCTAVELEVFDLQNRSVDRDTSDVDGNGDDDESPSVSSDYHK